MASVLGCSDGVFPFNYLGVPVGANMGLKSIGSLSSTNFKIGYPLGKRKHSRSVVDSPSLIQF